MGQIFRPSGNIQFGKPEGNISVYVLKIRPIFAVLFMAKLEIKYIIYVS
jgi:hypothetical protein